MAGEKVGDRAGTRELRGSPDEVNFLLDEGAPGHKRGPEQTDTFLYSCS